MSIPGNVIYFTGYDMLRSDPHSPIKMHLSDSAAPAVAGLIARSMAAFFVSPIEMFRVRLQASSTPLRQQSSIFRETLQGMHQLTKQLGVQALWRGLGITMWRDVPFSAIYWWGYEFARRRLSQLRHTSSPKGHYSTHRATFTDAFIAGTLSGTLASILTTPFDVGKTRKQVYQETSGQSAKADTVVRQSMPRLLRSIFQQEGLQGLFRGVTPRTAKVAPACAIMVSTFELSKLLARDANDPLSRPSGA